jgi:autoinducer 2 (AI-2) kinase
VAEARRKLDAILRDFMARTAADPVIRDFAKGKNVTVRYFLPDVDLAFHMAFAGDVPSCAMGDPPHKPHLTLKMDAVVLDDVMMERIGGMKAAMSGLMAFSGNTMKAMGLQRIQKDLCRLYAESRAAIGGPGDLKGLAAAAVEAPAPSSAAAPAPQAPSVAQAVTAAPAFVRRKVGDERDDLVLAVEELYAAKLLTSTGGNVSVRRASHPDEMWITPSSLPKGHLEPEMMVRVSLLDGEAMDEDAAAPSSERLMHARIMAARPDVTAVIHSHGTQAFLLGVTGLPFVPVCTESAFVGELGRVPFIMPGSDELAETAVRILANGRAVLLLNHGALVAAPSLRRGVDLTKVIERTSEVVLTCAKLGVKPPVLPADLVATLRSLDNAVA